MHPRRLCEEKRRLIAFVGSSSDGLDDLMSPPILINLDHYNSLMDNRDRFIQVDFKARALMVIWWTSHPLHRRTMIHTLLVQRTALSQVSRKLKTRVNIVPHG